MKRVLFLTNAPSPYRNEFFKQLGGFAEVTVLFERRRLSDRDKSWEADGFDGFRGIYLNTVSLGEYSFCLDIGKYLKGYDFIFVMNFTSPCGMAAIDYLRRHKIPYFLESDGGFAKSGGGIKERLKIKYISGAELYLSTSDMHDKYYIHYGAEAKKLARYPFSSVPKKDLLAAPPNAEEKAILRKKLGITEPKVVLSVGQFIPRKGFDLLTESAELYSADTGFYIIGANSASDCEIMSKGCTYGNFHFLPFMSREKINEYYDAADLFVLPTREDIWGLVINEALARGLPVVSTERCLSAVEMLKSSKEDFIVPINDKTALAKSINRLLNSASLYEIGTAMLKIAQGYTIEAMVKAHKKIISNR